ELAKSFLKTKTPVIIVDESWEDLRLARESGVPFYHGAMLSEQTEYNLDTLPYEYLISATEYHSYNALICTTFMPEYGRTNVFRISLYTDINGNTGVTVAKIGGRILFDEDIYLDDLNQKIEGGYVFKHTTLTEQYGYKQYLEEKDNDTIFLYTMKRSGKIRFYSEEVTLNPEAGDTIISLTPPKK